MILIDSGSTHNFSDEAIVENLQCPTQETLHFLVTVANGNKMLSTLRCQEFKWTMKGKSSLQIC